jgi:hypothetical protein
LVNIDGKGRTEPKWKNAAPGGRRVVISTIRKFVSSHECLFLHNFGIQPDNPSVLNIPKAPDAEAKAQSSFDPSTPSQANSTL